MRITRLLVEDFLGGPFILFGMEFWLVEELAKFKN
jgi:hypothetical protein